MSKYFALATVKAAPTDSDEAPSGAFDVILSAPTLDRDGEIIDAKAFDPLPDRITFDVDHGMTTSTTVGSGVPYYDDEGRLRVRGTFSSIPRAQEVRTLVAEGHISTTSVAFMSADRYDLDGVPHIKRAELLNGAFVPIPSNRESVVLSAKAYADRLDEAHKALKTSTVPAPADPLGDSPDGNRPASKTAAYRLLADLYASL